MGGIRNVDDDDEKDSDISGVDDSFWGGRRQGSPL